MLCVVLLMYCYYIYSCCLVVVVVVRGGGGAVGVWWCCCVCWYFWGVFVKEGCVGGGVCVCGCVCVCVVICSDLYSPFFICMSLLSLCVFGSVGGEGEGSPCSNPSHPVCVCVCVGGVTLFKSFYPPCVSVCMCSRVRLPTCPNIPAHLFTPNDASISRVRPSWVLLV